MKALRMKMTKRGLRAYYFSYEQCRWFPMPKAEAELMLATGTAYLAENPLPWATENK